jgi:hypothetical protein
MLTRRSGVVYAALLAIWIILIGWQVVEHFRVRRTARTELRHRAEDISSTLALLMRSQSFFGVISTNRLESALTELVKPGEFHPTSVVLLNARDEELASAGAPFDFQLLNELRGGEYWDDRAKTVMLMNLVDLGTNLAPSIVLSPGELRPPPRPGSNNPAATNGSDLVPTPPPSAEISTNAGSTTNTLTISNTAVALVSDIANTSNTNNTEPQPPRRGGRRRGDPGRPFERPYWMNVAEYENLIQKKGVHGFIVVMPTESLIKTVEQDLWLRTFIAILATISVAGYGLAWGNFVQDLRTANPARARQRTEFAPQGNEPRRCGTGARNAQSTQHRARTGADDFQAGGCLSGNPRQIARHHQRDGSHHCAVERVH